MALVREGSHRSFMRVWTLKLHKHTSATLLAAIIAALVALPSGPAQADRFTDLSTRLTKSDSDKIRIAAAVSLGRLKDERAIRPLVLALRDKSNVVRAVAAASLGGLGDSRALPALRRASLDKDATVRKRATEAIGVIRKNTSAVAGRNTDRFMIKSRPIRAAHYRVDGRETPRLSPTRPALFVSIHSSADDSPGKASKKSRKKSSTALRGLMQGELNSAKRITTNTVLADDLKLPVYAVDLSITRFQRVVRGPWVEVECELRIAISDDKGKMISFLTGGATVQVPKRSFRPQYESNMRNEALENAVKSVHQDLVRYLVKTSGV